MSVEVGSAFVRLLPSMRGFSAEVQKELDKGLSKIGQQAGQKTGQGFLSGLEKAGPKISAAGDKLTVGLTAPLVGLGAAAFTASKNFNAAMANVGSLIPGNTARVNELKTGVQDLAVTMGKSTDDMAAGLYQVVSAFGDNADSLKILDLSARAATAGAATTTEAINLLSAVTKGFGDTSLDAQRKAADLAQMTVNLGQTNFPELAASMGAVIPIAQNLGVTQEELFASMAAFTGATGSTSEVATQLRAALQALMAPTTAAAGALQAAGFASGQAAIEQLGLEKALGLLSTAAEQSGQPLQKFIGQVEGQTLALGLAGAQQQKYRESLAAMGSAAGATDAAFAEVTEGVNAAGFALQQAKTEAQVTAQRLGDGLAPALLAAFKAADPLVKALSALAKGFAALPAPVQTGIVGFAGIAAAVGPVMSVFGRMTGVIKTVISFGPKIVAFGKAFALAIRAIGLALAANPLGIIITALGLIVTGLVIAYTKSETFRRIVDGAFRVVGQAAMWLWDNALKPLWEGIKKGIDFVVPILLWWGEHVTLPLFRLVAGVAGWLWERIKIAFLGWKLIFQRLAPVISAWWNGVVKPVFSAVGAIVGWLWERVQLAFKGWQIIFGIVGKVISVWWAQVKAVFSAVASFVRSRIDAAVAAIDRLRAIVAKIRGFFEAARAAAVGRLNALVASVKGIGGRILPPINDLGRRMYQAGRRILQQLIDGIKSQLGGIGRIMGQAAQKVRNFWPFSPAREGPLSGRGDPFHAGRNVAELIAEGIRSGIRDVSGAGLALADQAIPSHGLTTAGIPSSAPAVAAPAVVIDATGLPRALAEWLRYAVRTQGGGSVQTAFGRAAQ